VRDTNNKWTHHIHPRAHKGNEFGALSDGHPSGVEVVAGGKCSCRCQPNQSSDAQGGPERRATGQRNEKGEQGRPQDSEPKCCFRSDFISNERSWQLSNCISPEKCRKHKSYINY
jgi:hypothetical protein